MADRLVEPGRRAVGDHLDGQIRHHRTDPGVVTHHCDRGYRCCSECGVDREGQSQLTAVAVDG